MDEQQIENRLTKLEESLDFIGEDLEELKSTQADIHSLALSVNTLALQGQTDCRRHVQGRKPCSHFGIEARPTLGERCQNHTHSLGRCCGRVFSQRRIT